MRTVRITDRRLVRMAEYLKLGERRDGELYLNTAESLKLEIERRRLTRLQAPAITVVEPARVAEDVNEKLAAPGGDSVPSPAAKSPGAAF